MSTNFEQRASQSGGLSHNGRPRVLVGVTGGIAAYKSAILVRRLAEWGADVTVVPTRASLDMVGKTTWEALTSNKVHVEVPEDAFDVVHVNTGKQADLFIIAPCTANTMAKITAGIGDNLLTASVLVATCPILIAPAMHTEMWLNSATQANLDTLKSRGFEFIGPETGRLTGADSGPGRVSEPEDIAARAIELLESRAASESTVDPELATDHAHHGDARAITISAGGTREAIDPVRYIANRSTGRMGVAIANEASEAGYRVRLVAANLESDVLGLIAPHVEVIPVVSADDLRVAMEEYAPVSDVIVMAAAVSDYRVNASDIKLKRDGAMTLDLIENPDILKDLATNRRRENQVIVGFAAETGDSTSDYLTYGKEKAARKNADLMAINQVGESTGFGDVETRLIIVDAAGEVRGDVSGSKDAVARGLLAAIEHKSDKA